MMSYSPMGQQCELLRFLGQPCEFQVSHRPQDAQQQPRPAATAGAADGGCFEPPKAAWLRLQTEMDDVALVAQARSSTGHPRLHESLLLGINS
jgi:hypothetical protein